MKKFLIICLCFVTLFTLCSCTKKNTSSGSWSSNDQPQQSAVSKTGTYTDIVCTKIESFKEVSFNLKGSETIVFINLPKNWSIKKENGGYSILKSSKTIGSITATPKTNGEDESQNVFCQELAANNIKVETLIDKKSAGNQPSYTRTLRYNYDDFGKDKSIIVSFNYEQADSSAVYNMMSTVRTVAPPKNNTGVFPLNDTRKKILILGNSFISTSNIGNILQDMCGSKLQVEAVSVGMATLSTFVEDGYTLQNIGSGKYSAVFMCGLFNEFNFTHLKKIITACDKSDTKLAVFPAHNESRTQIDRVPIMYPNTVVLDWKAEINALIDKGIAKSYFCIDDEAKHSTPLAGYVGAHMIYRAVFGEIPKTASVFGVTQSELKILGDYTTTGTISFLDKYDAYILDTALENN